MKDATGNSESAMQRLAIPHVSGKDKNRQLFLISPPDSLSGGKRKREGQKTVTRRSISSVFVPWQLCQIQAQMAVLEAFANQEAPARHILASALAKGKESMLYSLEGAPECETLEWMVSIATLAKLPANNGSAIRTRIQKAIKEANGYPLVQDQLELCISGNVFKANSAGSSKQAALHTLALHNPRFSDALHKSNSASHKAAQKALPTQAPALASALAQPRARPEASGSDIGLSSDSKSSEIAESSARAISQTGPKRQVQQQAQLQQKKPQQQREAGVPPPLRPAPPQRDDNRRQSSYRSATTSGPFLTSPRGEVSNWRPGNPVSSSLSMLGSGGYDPASLFQVGSPPPLPAICSRVHSSPAGKFSPLTFKTERLRKSFSVPQSSGRVPDTLVGVPSIDDERLGYVRGLGHPPRDRRLGSPSYGGFQLPSASPWQQQQRGEFPRQRLPVSRAGESALGNSVERAQDIRERFGLPTPSSSGKAVKLEQQCLSEGPAFSPCGAFLSSPPPLPGQVPYGTRTAAATPNSGARIANRDAAMQGWLQVKIEQRDIDAAFVDYESRALLEDPARYSLTGSLTGSLTASAEPWWQQKRTPEPVPPSASGDSNLSDLSATLSTSVQRQLGFGSAEARAPEHYQLESFLSPTPMQQVADFCFTGMELGAFEVLSSPGT